MLQIFFFDPARLVFKFNILSRMFSNFLNGYDMPGTGNHIIYEYNAFSNLSHGRADSFASSVPWGEFDLDHTQATFYKIVYQF